MPYRKMSRIDTCMLCFVFSSLSVDRWNRYYAYFRSTDFVARYTSLVPTLLNTWSDSGIIFVAPNHQAFLSYHVMRNPVLQSLKLLPRFNFIHQSSVAVWVFLICLSSNRCFYLRAILPHTNTKPNSVLGFYCVSLCLANNPRTRCKRVSWFDPLRMHAPPNATFSFR